VASRTLCFVDVFTRTSSFGRITELNSAHFLNALGHIAFGIAVGHSGFAEVEVSKDDDCSAGNDQPKV